MYNCCCDCSHFFSLFPQIQQANKMQFDAHNMGTEMKGLPARPILRDKHVQNDDDNNEENEIVDRSWFKRCQNTVQGKLFVADERGNTARISLVVVVVGVVVVPTCGVKLTTLCATPTVLRLCVQAKSDICGSVPWMLQGNKADQLHTLFLSIL